MVERQETAIKFLVSHQQLAKPIEPTVRYFYDPTSCLLLRGSLEFLGFLPSSFDMGDVAMLRNDLQGGSSCISSVSTQVLVPSDRRTGSLNHDGIKNCRQLRSVMPIGSGHDERQRDATPVHQKVTLAAFFFPDPSGYALRPPVPKVP